MFDEDKKYETEFPDADGAVTENQTDTESQPNAENPVEENVSGVNNNYNNTSSFLADDSGAGNDNNNSPYRNYNNSNIYNNYNSDYHNSNDKKNKKGGKGSVVLGLVLALTGVVLIGVVAFMTMNMNGNNTGKSGDEVAKSIISGEKSGDKKEYPSIASTDNKKDDESKEKAQPASGVVITDVSNIVENVMPSIVAITSQRKVEEYENFSDFDDFYRYFYGYDYDDFKDNEGSRGSDSGNNDDQYEDTGAGSGIIVKQTDSELLIVTNNHVVEGADALSILFDDGKTIKGQIKSTDSTADIAIVSIPLKDIDEETLNSIKIAELGDSDALNVGEGVVAIGNALGYGQSVTTGVISAKDRVISVDNKQMTVLQTDAAINGGNSGGALINSAGQVIGINVAKYSSSSYSSSASIEGMGFAIPISQALDTIDNLVSKEQRDAVSEAQRGSLGIVGSDVTTEGNEVYGIPFGVYIEEVKPDSAAEKAGLQKRDVILKFDGYSITTLSELKNKLKYYKAGETVEIVISRMDGYEYKEQTMNITLGKVK